MDPTMELFGDVAALSVETAPLSAKALDWLPAVENFGEGFFISLESHVCSGGKKGRASADARAFC